MRKWLIVLLGTILVGVTGAGYFIYSKVFIPNTPSKLENSILLIPTGATIESVIDSLEQNHQILNVSTFKWTAEYMDYSDETLKRGRYIIPESINNRKLIRLLRGGRQTPVKLTIQNVRTMDQLAGRVANKLEFDSIDLIAFLEMSFDTMADTKPETRMTRFIPNTYEFYWTVSPEEFCKRMLKEHDRFWNEERKSKLHRLQLSEEEVYTLASIVEKETNYNPEKPRVAGVYLNRIRTGMPLQADPTVVFAIGNFELRRVLYEHLTFDSPYNTYKYTGLPPGPIFMPGIPSIDAVLDAEEHNYIFFCARPTDDGPGHAFAETLQAHNQNANRYQRWLDKRGIQ